MSAKPRHRLATLLAVLVAIAFAALVVKAWREQEPRPLSPGMVRQTEIRIAPETTGRLATSDSHAGRKTCAGKTSKHQHPGSSEIPSTKL